MANDLLLTGNLAGLNKSEEISFNLIIESSRFSAKSKQQDHLTFELICSIAHSSPERLQIKTN